MAAVALLRALPHPLAPEHWAEALSFVTRILHPSKVPTPHAIARRTHTVALTAA